MSLAVTWAAPARAAARATRPLPDGEIEHPPAAHDLRMVEDIARQRLPAGPGKGPIGRRQMSLVERRLGRAPQRRHLRRQMQLDLRHQRAAPKPRFRANEGGLIRSGIAEVCHRPSKVPATMPRNRSQPNQRLEWNFARQSAASSRSTLRICHARCKRDERPGQAITASRARRANGDAEQEQWRSPRTGIARARRCAELQRRGFHADQRVVLLVLMRIDRVVGERPGNAARVKQQGRPQPRLPVTAAQPISAPQLKAGRGTIAANR